MKKALVRSVSNVSIYRSMITGAVLAACLLAAIYYAFNLYALVSGTVAIEQAEKKASALKSSISDLGAQYLKLSAAATPDRFAEYGLKQGQVSVYITRPSQTASIGNLARGAHEL